MNYVKLIYFIFLFPIVVFPQSANKQISFRDLTVDHGLSQNSVVSISQDSIGYMWFATQDGLNKYDGKTFTFYNKQFEDVTRPTFSKLGKTYIDRSGVLWIISNSGRLEKFNHIQNTFKRVNTIGNVSCIFQSFQKDYIVGTYGNGLFKIDHKTRDTLQIFKKEVFDAHIFDILESDSKLYLASSTYVFHIENDKISKIKVENEVSNFSTLAISKDKLVWLGTFGNGLFYKANNSDKFIRFKHDQLPQNLNIQDLLMDKSDRLWIATYGQGVYLLNIEKSTVQHYIANKNDPYALHYDDVLCLYEDFTGIIWLGSDGAGLSYYDEHLSKFNVITNKQVSEDVSVDVVRAITMDSRNTLWLGTSGKGLTSLNFDKQDYKTFTVNNSNLSGDRIMSLLFIENELWIGHQGEGLQIRDASGDFRSFPELKKQTIWKIYRDKKNRIWLCTREGGLVQFDKNKGVLKQFTTGNSDLTTNNIRTVEEGHDGKLWIGTEDHGLFVLNPNTLDIEKVDAVTAKIKSLYSSGEVLWIGTNGNGLINYNVSKNTANAYTIEEFLPNNVIYAILPDEHGNLWLSSNKGITRFNMNNKSKRYIANYTTSSGLQAMEFNTGAYFKDNLGLLYFGGLEGVNWFNPSKLTFNEAKPKTVISKFEIFGKAQPIIEGSNFRYDQNTMTFTFAGLHFSQPEANLYRYQLVNHDSDWTFPDFVNVAHYTNLPPNDYTFMVTSSNYDGVWNKTPSKFSFRILKPWYATNFAKIIYLCATLTFFLGIYRYLKFRWEVKTKLQFEHAETERLKKLDEFKTKLYTNISHEFRTPLTLISGPLDHQLSNKELKPEDRKELNLVKQNANRLLNLVNQMLDLSMIDSGQLQLNVSAGNLNVHLIQIVEAFQYIANDKEITIVSEINDLKNVWYDGDIVEKIVTNLVSNAIKYAPKNSEIIFDANEQDGALVLSIININNTISQKDFGKLFQRFYQEDVNIDGVGVGLALVKELVNVSKGKIIANNIDTDKIQFSVTLPISEEAFSPSEIKTNTAILDNTELKDFETNQDASQHTLLIVEDNDDIRAFIVSIFKGDYQIIETVNGTAGIEHALKYIPDVIISDIMMPIQDGIALCNELKYNELTSHIPIILLTAKVGDENEIEGLRTGADAYITKPFNSEKLKLRVKKLIENRQQLQKHFSKDFTINPELAITSTETEFLKRLKETLDIEITNPDFTSERFAEAMNMSRTQLHRKLKAIVNMSATEFIRSQRLKLSLTLLKQSDATISEVAYQIGFNTPSYFIKCFKETYGCTPNEYLSKN